MAQFRTDLRDIYFNLFEVLKIQDHSALGENDLKEIITEYNKFIANEVYPTRTIGDHEGVHLKDGVVTTPKCFRDPHKKFYENGWYTLGYSEDVGGMPAPHSVSFACQSISNSANVAWSMYYGLTKGAMDVILAVGSEEQRSLFVPKMMTGEWGGTMCLTEPGAGSDVGAATTTATPNGDGTFKIKGVKIFISSGDNDLYDNIVHLVLAKTPGAPQGTKGLSLFIVPKLKIDKQGNSLAANDVRCTKIEEKMGIHGQATCELTFGANGNCDGVLIGKEFEGMQNMFIMMNHARLLCGIQGESQANLALQLSEQYVNERVQFGKEIAQHPDVKRMMLKMRAMSRGMRSLVLYTGDLFDQMHHGNAEVENEIAFLTPICKSFCSDEGFQVAVDAIQVHGGYGFCSEYGIEQFARDTKIATIYEGTNGIQAIDFTMRKVLKDNAKTLLTVGAKIQKTLAMPEAQEFKNECEYIAKNLQKTQEILTNFADHMKKQNTDAVLTHATSFLNFVGNLIVSWRLLASAIEAKKKLASGANPEETHYYQSKIVDFKIFVQHYLTRNASLAQQVLNFDNDLSHLKV